MNPLRLTTLLILPLLPLTTPTPLPLPLPTPTPNPSTLSTWSPAYTSYLPLPGYDGAIALAADGDTLWLATETEVSRFDDGVWDQPEQLPGVTKIFALAPMGGDGWAFGFEGEAWQYESGSWRKMSCPVAADLYSAVARNRADVWAAGFDYEREKGVLVRWDGQSLVAAGEPQLNEQLLFTIAEDPTGELWAGGCNYYDELVLLRDGGTGNWAYVQTPPVTGCVYHLAFSPDGLGLAAVGSDILEWDGVDWSAAGISPPEEYQWVRVAGTPAPDDAVNPASTEVSGTGWAIAGIPTWRSYTDGQPPWYFDGRDWMPTEVDYRGLDDLFIPSEENPEPRPFVNLTANGERAWSVSRVGGAVGVNGEAAIIELVDGAVRFTHPLLESAAAIDAPSPGEVWVGGRYGAMPLLNHDGAEWAPAAGPGFATGQFASVASLDMATPLTGWALGSLSDNPLARGGGERAAWRWDGQEWHAAPPPPAVLGTVRLRALPDGGAWVTGATSQIVAFDGEQWAILKDAPPVAHLRLKPPRFSTAGAPFDLARTDEGLVGCIAGRDAMYAYKDGTFRRVAPKVRGQVIDLQLTDARHGWAIAFDRGTEDTVKSPTGVLVQLRDCQPTEVIPALKPDLVSHRQIISNVEWEQMSAVSSTEVWLWGNLSGPGFNLPVLVRAHPLSGRPARKWSFQFGCDVRALSAVAVDGGTDVWLVGYRPCGPSPSGVLGRGYAGPVSRLRVRKTVDQVWLPIVMNGTRRNAQHARWVDGLSAVGRGLTN